MGWIPHSALSKPLSAAEALGQLDQGVHVIQDQSGLSYHTDISPTQWTEPSEQAAPVIAYLPPLTPNRLGHPSFQTTYGVKANYIAGAMANGIGSEAIVIAMANAGLLGVFGAGGLGVQRIEQALLSIKAAVGPRPFGMNLIHSPQVAGLEWSTVQLYLSHGVNIVSAAAFVTLSDSLVYYRVKGLYRDVSGQVQAPNRLLAKISREEVAAHFLKAPPSVFIDRLFKAGHISEQEATLSSEITMADDLIAEADSGGHTDNRAALVLLPLLFGLREDLAQDSPRARGVRVGLAGGISTPMSTAAAFALGADFVLTGSVNQACVESGTSTYVKELLAKASATDVGMAPASDMFEAGVQVQVLKRGTLFAMRAQKLYALWHQHPRLEAIPQRTRDSLERDLFMRPLSDIWSDCVSFFSERDPAELEQADRDPKHKMALVFRWYLGQSSRWAIQGDPTRRMDMQIWCGPGIGAFNAWTQGSFLSDPAQRDVVSVALNFMAGAASITRAHHLLQHGIDVGAARHSWIPRPIR